MSFRDEVIQQTDQDQDQRRRLHLNESGHGTILDKMETEQENHYLLQIRRTEARTEACTLHRGELIGFLL